MIEPLLALEALFERGGPVLYGVSAALLAMWVLIFERLLYLRVEHPRAVKRATEAWQARSDHTSRRAGWVRRALLSEVREGLERRLFLLRTLVGLCTLLGLLGTVTGMIQLFDAVGVAGGSTPRALADGVARATLPTAAGLVAALSGAVPAARLGSAARREVARLAGWLEADRHEEGVA